MSYELASCSALSASQITVEADLSCTTSTMFLLINLLIVSKFDLVDLNVIHSNVMINFKIVSVYAVTGM